MTPWLCRLRGHDWHRYREGTVNYFTHVARDYCPRCRTDRIQLDGDTVHEERRDGAPTTTLEGLE
jgi:hypothetical protein